MYTPHTWTTGDTISAALLNSLEAGVGSAAATVLNVRDFGAVGDGSTDDTAAIQSAINAGLATSSNRYGAVVFFPSSYSAYRYTQLNIITDREAQITLRGAGNATLRPIAASDSLGPSIVIKPLTTPVAIGAGYLRHVHIEDLKISGTGDPYADSRTSPGDTDPYSAHRKRVGIHIEATQDFSMRNVFLTHFRIGLRTKDLFDSELQNVQFLNCGYSINDTLVTNDFTTGYGYSLDLDEFLDQSNANKFLNCHFEGGPLFVRFGGGSRQNNFTGCKFENRTPAADDTSTKSAIWFEDAIENQFTNCMFTEDATRGKSYVRADSVDSAYTTTYNVKQAAIFSNCLFFANSASKGLWFRGNYGKFFGCQFNRSDGAGATYPFIFGSHNTMLGCTITLADAGINTLRVSNSYNYFRNNLIDGPASGSTGALYFVDNLATNNYVQDNETVGSFSTVISTSLSDLGSNIFSRAASPVKTITTGATPNVFLADILVCNHSSATSITNFLSGHNGKRFLLRAGTNNITLVHASSTLYLKGAVNRALATGDVVNFINDAGVWRET